MKPNPKYLNQENEFWAAVKLLSQRVGYSKGNNVIVPTILQIRAVFREFNLSIDKIEHNGALTPFGTLLLEYFQYRADVLNNSVRGNLMDVDAARAMYNGLVRDYTPTCRIPINRQAKANGEVQFFTAIINILIEQQIGRNSITYDPQQITAFTVDNFPAKSLSRRLDGSFPDEINPIAVWEIKEYYFTTSFGSRIADGVYESMLDGYELHDARRLMNREVFHYLMIDAHFTWWVKGKSYLCRIIDMMHMGLITECIVGREVVDRIPIIVKEWLALYEAHRRDFPPGPQATISFPQG